MAKQYEKKCRDCDQTLYMQEQGDGKWRAFEDVNHTVPHHCQKSLGSSQSSGQAGAAQKPTEPSEPAKSPLLTPTGVIQEMLQSREFENKVRLIARSEIEKMLKKAMAF
jgi:hypothetical protein